jgi:2-enoate reductase
MMAKLIGFDVVRLFAGPSADLPNVWDSEIKTTEMTRKEIDDLINAYGKTALLCQKAGIDGVEIHAVHEGYLLDQFTMSATNKRTDEYGGSLENRLRFVTEIIKSIKAACGKDYPVSVRYSVESKMIAFNIGAVPGEEHKEFGRGREESIQVAQLLEAAGADLLNADNGSYDSWYWAHPPMYMPLCCNLDSAAFIKQYVKIPVVCAGRMEDPDRAAQAVAGGKIDAVGVGRQFLCDGEYVTKIQQGRVDDIRPCIACHNGCFAIYRYKGVPAGMPATALGHCALNPATFHEQKYAIRPASQQKKVAVIGGGIGGMEAARLCALRGHSVTLYEKSGELGGVFIAAAAPGFKEKDKMLLAWCKRQLAALPVDLRLNREIKRDDLADLGVDEIIIATGARPRRPPIGGLDRDNVMEAIEYLRGYKQVGERVVVVGGGLTGCEIAYDLVLKGKKPVIVEMLDDILKVKEISAANTNMLRDLIRCHKIPVELEARVTEITADGVRIETPSGARLIPADSVVISVGYEPGTPLAEKGGGHVHIVGDALKVGNLMHVIWRAYDVAFSI